MNIESLIFNIKKLLKPDDYVTDKTRMKYEDNGYDLPIPLKFDEKSSKYKGRNN